MRNREITPEDAAPIDPLINVSPPLEVLTPALLDKGTFRPSNGRHGKHKENPLTQFATDEFDQALVAMNLVKLHKLSVGPRTVLDRTHVVDLIQTVRKGERAQRRLGRNGDLKQNGHFRTLIEEGQKARSELTESNQGLVIQVASKYIGQGVDFEDLVQEGNLGLLRAIERFDPDRGTEFSTIAIWWIFQKVSNVVMDQSRTARIPRDARREMLDVYKAGNRLAQQLNREPTFNEVSDELGLPTNQQDGGKARKKLRWKIQKSQTILSLDEPIDDDVEETTMEDFIVDESTPSPFTMMKTSQLQETVADILDELPVHEAQVLRLRFGLRGNGEKDSHLFEIGQRFGFTGENARLVENAALKRIRLRPDWRRKLRDFLRED